MPVWHGQPVLEPVAGEDQQGIGIDTQVVVEVGKQGIYSGIDIRLKIIVVSNVRHIHVRHAEEGLLAYQIPSLLHRHRTAIHKA
jgi:hypothetical protein